MVGAVGYSIYAATSGIEFNWGHFGLATGGGLAAGALIGTGVGWTAGVSQATATTAAITAVGLAESANKECGGEMCSSEIGDANKIVTNLLPKVQNATTAITQYYPPQNGFIGEPEIITLKAGQLLDRFGSKYGQYLTDKGTPPWRVSLPPGTTNFPTTFRVIQPFEMVAKGTTAGWFDQPGGGIQYCIGFLG